MSNAHQTAMPFLLSIRYGAKAQEKQQAYKTQLSLWTFPLSVYLS